MLLLLLLMLLLLDKVFENEVGIGGRQIGMRAMLCGLTCGSPAHKRQWKMGEARDIPRDQQGNSCAAVNLNGISDPLCTQANGPAVPGADLTCAYAIGRESLLPPNNVFVQEGTT